MSECADEAVLHFWLYVQILAETKPQHRQTDQQASVETGMSFHVQTNVLLYTFIISPISNYHLYSVQIACAQVPFRLELRGALVANSTKTHLHPPAELITLI